MKRVLLALTLACLSPCVAAQDFYAVVLGDTQWQTAPNVAQNFQVLLNTTSAISFWQPRPVVVLQVGDLTQNATPEEFHRARYAMRITGAPWISCVGNHDLVGGQPCGNSGPCFAQWERWIGPPQSFTSVPTPGGPISVLSLPYYPTDESIEQAQLFLDVHQSDPAVVVTHSWLERPAGSPAGSTGFTNAVVARTGSNLDGPGNNSPAQTWEKLVQTCPQIFLILCGHAHAEGRRVDTTMFGRRVDQLLLNPQDEPYGGNGWTRILHFRQGSIDVWTFSVTYTGTGNNWTSFFSLPVDLSRLRNELGLQRTRRFATSADTYVRPVWGGHGTHGNATLLYCASGPSSAREHALLRFDLRLLAGRLSNAVLTLTVEGYSSQGAGFTVHRMLRPWDESSSWNSINGLAAGVDYALQADAVLGAHGRGTFNLDVTTAVQAWQAGQPNYGWVFIGAGESSGFRSREWEEPAERPMLTVR